jgi:hypothetical protein
MGGLKEWEKIWYTAPRGMQKLGKPLAESVASATSGMFAHKAAGYNAVYETVMIDVGTLGFIPSYVALTGVLALGRGLLNMRGGDAVGTMRATFGLSAEMLMVGGPLIVAANGLNIYSLYSAKTLKEPGIFG